MVLCIFGGLGKKRGIGLIGPMGLIVSYTFDSTKNRGRDFSLSILNDTEGFELRKTLIIDI